MLAKPSPPNAAPTDAREGAAVAASPDAAVVAGSTDAAADSGAPVGADVWVEAVGAGRAADDGAKPAEGEHKPREERQEEGDEWPASAAVEIERIGKARNHYAVLHVSAGATYAEMKKNYHTLARILHHDRCQLEGAGEAMSAVSQAYETLTMSDVAPPKMVDKASAPDGAPTDARESAAVTASPDAVAGTGAGADGGAGADVGVDVGAGTAADGGAKGAEAEQKQEEGEEWPASADVEIERIGKAPNHYAVLHVSAEATYAQMKKNYYTLARILHPDRCQLEGAGEAMSEVSQAYDTLTNRLKKTLYDQFLSQAGGEQSEPNQTYQEWESRQQPVELPKWLNLLLGIRGVGYLFVIIITLLVLPVVVLIFVVYVIFLILWIPVRIVIRIFFPERYAQMKEREAREIAKWEEEAQDRMFAHV